MTLDAVFARLIAARSRVRLAVAALAGVLAAAALPPLGLLPVLLLSWTVVYALWNAAADAPRRNRATFLLGWAFGTGYFSAGLYWVAYAFLVDAATFGWMIPFALLGLGAGFGLFPGLAFWAAARASASLPLVRWIGFAAVWVVVEWLRGWVLTGFPWNSLGSVWAFHPAWAQGAALAGMFGLSWITLLAATAPVAGGLGAFGAARGWLRGCGVLAAILAIQGGLGALRLPAAAMPTVPDVNLRLVQPDIAQTDKWRPELREDNLMQQVVLSRSPGWEKATHVIWSETAASYPLDIDAFHRFLVAEAAPRGGWLLTGMPRRTPPGTPLEIWNSLVAIDSSGRIADVYDKFHLVPFGEYVPGGGILPVAKLTGGRVDFSPGPGLRTVRLPHTPPYSPLICYEIIFPGEAVRADDRPAWIVNVTNDGWFGLSAGPYQHLSSAVLRALEEGLPVARAANTGISAVIDPYGRIVASLDLGRAGVVDSSLPQALPPTPFARYGNALILATVLASLAAANLVAFWCLRRRSILPT